MIHINVNSEYWSKVNTTELRHAARTACSVAGLSADSEFTIVITNDEQVRELNMEYRQKDQATDVLSFPSQEKDPDTGRNYLGDIIISFPRANQQATDTGHAVNTELILLVIHGILHLSGHDHIQSEAKETMFGLQNEALNRLDIKVKGFND